MSQQLTEPWISCEVPVTFENLEEKHPWLKVWVETVGHTTVRFLH